MEPSERKWIKCCLDGQPEHFRYLIQRYQGPLAGFLRGRMEISEVDDVIQETFLRAYSHLRELKNRDAFFPWLMGIAQRVGYEVMRNEKKQRELTQQAVRQTATMTSTVDYDLNQALAELPDGYRQLIQLRYYSGMTCLEIADQLRLPLGTVTKKLSRAYALLRQGLIPQPGTEVKL